ncbi:MAG TPA: BTAD domain-containing putative transcriptional regulator [Burkholderiales bacterium]|nr:BTAD domain-containing putative transcriptional regulator [Burkholderiales bacterium]
MGRTAQRNRPERGRHVPSLRVRLFGPVTVARSDVEQTLPASRKARALFAYLALASHPITRSHLCELLWDSPNDPRGELRWCLSKIRSLVDEPGRRRVATRGDTVSLDLTGCSVDAHDVANATQQGVDALTPEQLRTLSALFFGDLLEGLEIEGQPLFNGWLVAQRRRFRGYHAALLERLVAGVPDDEAFGYIEQWIRLAPFDRRVHETLLKALARSGRIREGEEHVAATVRLFEAEGIDPAFLHEAWRAARAQPDTSGGVSTGAPPPATALVGQESNLLAARRASIAVMPFVDRSTAALVRGGPADGLVYDVITRLAKLRSLFVIAQGTVFALRERCIAPEEAGRMLNVDYVTSGSLQRQGNRLTVSVELAETRSARIVWAEVFNHRVDDTFLILDDIGNRIVASIAHEIENIERNRAMLRPPSSLDAWEAHHRGLWHMYRFNRTDNERAQHFFETAVRLDPTFARAYAGLSFTHFQKAFQGWADRTPEIERALSTAGQSLMVDDRDPAAHWAMGRALWLNARQDESMVELEKAVELSPNFAVGHYTLAFVQSQAGDARAAIRASDHSRHLSPFDPLMFAMLGARAMALVRLGRFEEAAEWGMKAAARPNAHAHIYAIAAYSLALAGRVEDARSYLAKIHNTLPRYGVEDLLTAMRFEPAGAALFREGAKRVRSV